MIWYALLAYLAACYLAGLYLTLRLHYRKHLRHVLSMWTGRLRRAVLRSVPSKTTDTAPTRANMPERQAA